MDYFPKSILLIFESGSLFNKKITIRNLLEKTFSSNNKQLGYRLHLSAFIAGKYEIGA